jgi:hypothetical protein
MLILAAGAKSMRVEPHAPFPEGENPSVLIVE